MADGPHRESGSDRFPRAPWERGDADDSPSGRHGRHQSTPRGAQSAVAHPGGPPPMPRPRHESTGRHQRPDPVDPPFEPRYSTPPSYEQPFDPWYATGPQPYERPYPADPRPRDRRHATGPQPTEHRYPADPPYSRGARHDGPYDDGPYPAGPAPAGRRYPTGPQGYLPPEPDRRYTTGPQAFDRGHHTGPHPVDRRYPTGPQPIDRRTATGPQPIDRRTATGPHTFDRRYTTGPQEQDRRYTTGPQQLDRRFSTGPQPYDRPRTDEPSYFGGHPDEHEYPARPRSYDRGYPSGPQPYDPRRFGPDPYEDQDYDDAIDDVDSDGGVGVGVGRDVGTDADGDEDQPGSTRLRRKKVRRQRRLVQVWRIAAALVAIGVFLATGFTWGTKKWADDGGASGVSALDLNSSSIVDAPLQAGDQNFLLLGTDARAAADTAPLVVHVPQDRSRVVVVSFPADVEVDQAGCDGAAQGAIRMGMASEFGGPLCVTRAVQRLSGLSVNHFVGIDFAGFTAMVDAVDGVQVCVDGPVRDAVLGGVVDRPGPVDLTGEQALAFFRARHVEGDPATDEGRVRRQQRFMAALVREIVAEPAKLDALAAAVATHAVVDGTDADDLRELGRALREVGPERVSFVTVPAAGGDPSPLFRAIIDGVPFAGEKPREQAPGGGGPQPTVTVPPDQVKMQVLNGTGEDGLATQVTRTLRSGGFDVVKVANAAQPEERTVIRYAAGREAQAWSVAAAVPGAVLQLDPSMGGAVELVLGAGFDGTIEPVELGAPVDAQPPAEPAPSGPAAPDVPTLNGADTSCA